MATLKRMLKKAISGVLGFLSCSRTSLYAPLAKKPAALLSDLFEHSFCSIQTMQGKE